jgi:uncharacterized SAM-binding protein YcdF (DUF218 family)
MNWIINFKMRQLRGIVSFLLKTGRVILLSSGVIALLMSILAFTPLPYHTRHWLAQHNSKYNFTPEYIIMLGGSGMPSADNLIRLYYTAVAAETYPKATIIISHPSDSLMCEMMKNELLSKQVSEEKILFEKKGTNTRYQVMEIQKRYPNTITSPVIVVTCPEQMWRTVSAFRKAGYSKIGGYPTFSCDMYTDLQYNTRKLKGSKYMPEVGDNLSVRYNFWNYLKLEITCLREFTALAYYKLNGWI